MERIRNMLGYYSTELKEESKISASEEPPSECPINKAKDFNPQHPNGLPLPKMLQGGCPRDEQGGGNGRRRPGEPGGAPQPGAGPGPGQAAQHAPVGLQHSKGDETPHHQKETNRKWVYPSEQMYYNAMKRKGWDPREEDMPAVVAIHNFVNEEGWSEPRLIRFQGDATKLSPRARLNGLLGYSLPFDRHDWVVGRPGPQGAEQEVRYVLDYYSGAPVEGKPVSMHMDVRPALDSLTALLDRFKVAFNDEIYPVFDLFPGQKDGGFFPGQKAGTFSEQLMKKGETTRQEEKKVVAQQSTPLQKQQQPDAAAAASQKPSAAAATS
eukprot:CAMPEP_0194699960 /NCGR_PEP_ID=MMETSP0295-20121207/25192_1 /TAXON_ID=39354 /ORGANISM="Heterosigma akashiwo, Strain CCMP2393" /LENGTH=323 /DNA_ID=CAMNT_0039593641 /DNA_START=180 /DNA_END=1152 /DNA_ORIENTATION=-